MGHLKVVMAVVLALTLALLLYPPTRAHAGRLLRAMLWAACAMTASTGAIDLPRSAGGARRRAGGGERPVLPRLERASAAPSAGGQDDERQPAGGVPAPRTFALSARPAGLAARTAGE